ncbi:MAG: efflux RND transporter permease subunit [Clostridium fessum]
MMKSEFSSLYRAIAIAVFLVFVVMAAQFESVKFSIMVMTTIPFSLVGSFGLLKLTGVSISMTSLLGFLILVGTVVNNGILYVDTVNQYRSTMDLRTALIEAGCDPVSDRF